MNQAIASLESEIAGIRTEIANLGKDAYKKKVYSTLTTKISYRMAKIYKIKTEEVCASIDECSCASKHREDLKTLVSAGMKNTKKIISKSRDKTSENT